MHQLSDSRFLEAIYLASPVLYDECIKWKNGGITNPKDVRKIFRSVVKYFTRMSSRCTPFGLFSTCTTLKWNGTDENNVLVNSKEVNRHTRLDMYYLCALAQKIATMDGIKEGLLYFPNTSIYRIGDEVRYIEFKFHKGSRFHQVSSVMASSYLDDILSAASGGITTDAMKDMLMANGVGETDALKFVDELIGSQVLTSELDPAITGEEFIYQLIKVLNRLHRAAGDKPGEILYVLEETDRLIKELDNNTGNPSSAYRKIMSLLALLEVSYEEGKLFQTDAIRVLQNGDIGNGFQSQLIQAIHILNKLCFRRESKNLQSFAKRFYERYEEREMPLAEVMDPETGIGYIKIGNAHTPLVEDIVISDNRIEENITWGRLESFLKDKLQSSWQSNQYELEIKDEDVRDFTAGWDDLPPSLSVMFRLINEGDSTIYIESAGGSSAVNLLGRFAHADDRIHTLVCDIAKKEQENDPDIIYAEIIHLPDNRAGNVLLHPAFRDYEIPFLAKSSLPADYQIGIQDLMVSVRHGNIILRSKRLNKRIIPRLSTAHNYNNSTIPVYRFLCDLQTQVSGLHFSWGGLGAHERFLPRIKYRNSILHAATWHLRKEDCQVLLKDSSETFQRQLSDFRAKWKLPRYVVLADGDNELFIDFMNELLVQTWLETIKNREEFVLKEFFYSKDSMIKDEKGDPYVNQLVAVLIKQNSSYSIRGGSDTHEEMPVTRRFSPGSEWLYYKLYCGIASADKILSEAVMPLTAELMKNGQIDKWFFIRYNDPNFHLRIRFHLRDLSKTGDVIGLARSYFLPFEQDDYIWKSQIDTYNREIERYGSNTIVPSESIFYHDSVAVLQMLLHSTGDDRENIRWLWGLRSVDELLNCFRLSQEEKLVLLTRLKNDFAAEFNMNRSLKMQLDQKYRNNRDMIATIMDPGNDLQSNLYPLVKILEQRTTRIIPLAANILELCRSNPARRSGLLGSYIHMLLNRLITSDQRLHELVIYDFLFRQYQSRIARDKRQFRDEQTPAKNIIIPC